VGTANPIVDVNVTVNIGHSWIGDITLILRSPEGTSVELISGACDSSRYEDLDVIFDDEGVTIVCGTIPPAISGVIKPKEALSKFKDESSAGIWTLRAIDNAAIDSGTLESWSLELCTSQPLGIEFGELANFKIYPNPSRGEIHISFEKDANDVEMTLYDLLGRLISKNDYTNPSQYFDETIDLSQIAKGIYILRIKNGDHFSSRKIQIQ
jgi:subtilisin-like proprotein convertase family protein